MVLAQMTSDGSVTQDGFIGSYSCIAAPDCTMEDLVLDWSGGTRIGASLRVFNRRHARRMLGQGAVVLLIALQRGAAAERVCIALRDTHRARAAHGHWQRRW